MADLNPSRPGHIVFGRRRQMRALAPADSVLGVPKVYCPETATSTPNRLTVNMSATVA